MSDLNKLFEQLADGPVLLATAFTSVDAVTTTALLFVVRMDAEGVVSVRLIA